MWLSASPGARTVSLSGAGLVVSLVAAEVTVSLTEAQRVAAIALSGVPGGDGSATLFEVGQGALKDLSSNEVLASGGVSVSEVADTVPPTVVGVALDFNDGTLTVSASETLKSVAGNVDLSRWHLSGSAGGGADVALTGASLVESTADSVVLTLTEAQRASAIALSGVPGGDGSAVLLEVGAGGFLDVGLVPNQASPGSVVAERADVYAPVVTGVALDYGTGVLTLSANETLLGGAPLWTWGSGSWWAAPRPGGPCLWRARWWRRPARRWCWSPSRRGSGCVLWSCLVCLGGTAQRWCWTWVGAASGTWA